MPCYPAIALLIGSVVATNGRAVRGGTRVLTILCACAVIAAIAILVAVRHVPTPGDISEALSSHPAAYKLSLGHMEDLTVDSFAYLRLPLSLAAIAFCIGAIGNLGWRGQRAFFSTAVMMVLFFQAARLAMVDFDPYLSSRPLVEALERAPQGRLIVNRHYYPFSSVFFYTNRTALLLNGRSLNLVYGSYAPGAPNVFIDDAQFRELWDDPQRSYLAAPEELLPHLGTLVSIERLIVVVRSGGKILLTNQPLPPESLIPAHAEEDGPVRSGSLQSARITRLERKLEEMP